MSQSQSFLLNQFKDKSAFLEIPKSNDFKVHLPKISYAKLKRQPSKIEINRRNSGTLNKSSSALQARRSSKQLEVCLKEPVAPRLNIDNLVEPYMPRPLKATQQKEKFVRKKLPLETQKLKGLKKCSIYDSLSQSNKVEGLMRNLGHAALNLNKKEFRSEDIHNLKKFFNSIVYNSNTVMPRQPKELKEELKTKKNENILKEDLSWLNHLQELEHKDSL